MDPTALSAMTGPLVARTVPLTDRVDIVEVDPLDIAGEEGVVWIRPGLTLVGRGTALTIDIPADDPATAGAVVDEALGRIDHDDPADTSGAGAIALGALPFDRSKPGRVVVPSLLVGRREDGSGWITAVSSDASIDPENLVRDAIAASTHERPRKDLPTGPTRFDIRSQRSIDDWCAALVAAREELRAGFADKVVLARAVDILTDEPISRRTLLERLRAVYPSCMIYGIDDLVGASPELLVARDGNEVRSHPMAGTAPRSDDPVVDARLAADLKASAKDLVEHRYTIDMVHETLLPWCSWLDEEAEPSLVTMANVRHLATLVEGRLSDPPASVVELLRALHPTPAVCGSPRERAFELIDRLEELDRDRYAGAVGWVDSHGDGEWAVAIRCARLTDSGARLMAGVGVVADSDPVSELAETRAKLQALLGAIVRP